MNRDTGNIELADGGALYYECAGTGPPLLLVPGLGGVGNYWEPHVEALAQRYRVIIHDHRGTGQSSIERIDYSVEQMAADVIALMVALETGPASLIGHSTGGAIGQTIALDHPERLVKLVLSSTWTRADAYFKRLFTVRKRILNSGGPAHYMESAALFMSPPDWIRDHPPPEISAAEAAASMPDPEVAIRRIDAILRFDRSADLHRIRCPVLVSCARDDLVTPFYYSQALAQAIPGAQTAFVDHGGHFYPATNPELFRASVVSFLEA